MSDSPRASTAPSSAGQRALIGGAIVLFALVAAYLALVIITRVDSIFFPGNQIRIPGANSFVPLPGLDTEGQSGNQDRINILVLGLDKRPADGDTPTRTDTIFVVTVDPKTKSTGILGIPRDLVVDIPYQNGNDTYEDRINTVFVAGELNGYDQGGLKLMKEVISSNFGIEINKHVLVDFEGFEEIIDALGGIDVDVPDAVYDPYYSETELPGDYFPQDFDVGVQHMDGRTALAYSRIRFSSDDLDRIQRQQRVIFATIDKAKSLNLFDVKDAPKLWDKYNKAIETDVNSALIVGYARLANDVKDNINAISLGPATAPCTGPGNAAWLCSDPDAVERIVQSLFVDDPALAVEPSATPDPVSVQIQNGTGTDGLATRVVNYLAAQQNYPVEDLNPANVFDGETHEVSEVIDLDGTNEQNGYLLAKWLNIDASRYREATEAERATMAGADADIVVILGSDIDFDELIQAEDGTTNTGG